jgi:4-amino-4-deoxy-L-arabinose transferase-like glycosyltransferase
VRPQTNRLRNTCVAWLACIFFFLAGLIFVPLLGIEDDESLFAQAIYPPRGELYSLRIGHSRFPLMLMSYLGTLKAYLFRPIFRVFGTGVFAFRIPALVAGAASIFLFYLLLRRVSGERAALIGCGLLAVDSMYLLTATFDWGPVALQHLLLVGGMLLLLRFYQTREHRALAGGFFLFGLAMWDKALAVWLLSGFGVAALVAFPRQVLNVLTRRRVALAVLAFLLGSFPLVIYNFGNHWVTFRGNFKRETNVLGAKARFLADTAGGAGLFGWMMFEDWQTPRPHQPATAIEKASARISALAGNPRHHLLLYCVALALLLAPLARGNELRGILFALVALAVAWIQMAVTASAGASVHHTILLWPLPQMIVALAFAAASRRLGRAGIPAVAIVTAAGMISGALVMNEYYNVAFRYGGGQAWSDAIYPLSDYLKKTPARTVFCLDWGMLDALRLLNRGKLPLAVGTDQLNQPQMSAADRDVVLHMISDPENLFIAHTKPYEFFPGAAPKLLQAAAEAGFERRLLTTITDRYGRAVFELFRFVPSAGAGGAGGLRAPPPRPTAG